MRDEDRDSQDGARYEAKAKLRMQQLGSAGSSLGQAAADEVEQRIRRNRVIGRKIAR